MKRVLGVLLSAVLIAGLVGSIAAAPASAGSGDVIQPMPPVKKFTDEQLQRLDKRWSNRVFDYAPAYPGPVEVTQPDGSKFQAELTGAEIGGTLQTLSGHTVVKNKAGWWTYAVKTSDGVVPSDRIAGQDSPEGLPTHVGQTQAIWIDPSNGADIRTQLFEYFRAMSVERTQTAQAQGEATTYDIPVLMLETKGAFQDDSTPASIEKFLDGWGGNPNGTVTEFYAEQSYGQMIANIDVFGPYKSVPSQVDPCHYGGISGTGRGWASPQNQITSGFVIGPGGGGAAAMLAEAIPQADPEVDFSKYDNNHDGYIDLVFVLHSGPDMAATGDPCDPWSHAISLQPVVEGLTPATEGIPTNDVCTLEDGTPTYCAAMNVNTVPEIGLNVGVVSHEMSHNLGEPDFYDTSYKSMGTGDWDNMAGGSWFGDPPGSNPIHFNPLVKLAQAWIDPKVVTSTEKGISLRPWEIFKDLVLIPTKRGDEPNTAEEETDAIIEGYLIHYSSRTAHGPRNWGSPLDGDDKVALFDRHLLNSGAIVWHMDRAQEGNDNSARYRLDLEEFDYLDTDQELALNLTRGEPTDPYFDTATGLSSATRYTSPGGPSEGLTYQGTAPPSADAQAVAHEQEWTVPVNPANSVMQVLVHCDESAGPREDWDFYVDEYVNGEWVEVAEGATTACDESTAVVQPTQGGRYRSRVYNYSSVGGTAGGFTGEVKYSTAEVFFRPDTYTNDGEATGWSIGNFRPKANGLQLSSEILGPQRITFDAINSERPDVSAGFVRSARALRESTAQKVTTEVFNNGGSAAGGVTARLYDNGDLVDKVAIGSLKGGDARKVTFRYSTPHEGPHSLRVDVASSSSESSDDNNSQVSEVWVSAKEAVSDGVLIVDDDGGFATEMAYAQALASIGVPYAITDKHPHSSELKKYQAVIWESGLERMKGQLDLDDLQQLKKYLLSGGKLWISSPRLAGGIAAPADDANPGADPEFAKNFFGIGYGDTVQRGGGVAFPLAQRRWEVAYAFRPYTGRPLQDIPTIQQSEFGRVKRLFDWHQGDALVGPIGTAVYGDDEHGGFETIYTGFNLSSVLQGDQQRDLVARVMRHFGVKATRYEHEAPVLLHSPIRTALRGEGHLIHAVVDGRKASDAVLKYREFGTSRWSSVRMKHLGGGLVSAYIPGGEMQNPGVEYRIVAGKLTAPTNENYSFFISIPKAASKPTLPY